MARLALVAPAATVDDDVIGCDGEAKPVKRIADAWTSAYDDGAELCASRYRQPIVFSAAGSSAPRHLASRFPLEHLLARTQLQSQHASPRRDTRSSAVSVDDGRAIDVVAALACHDTTNARRQFRPQHAHLE